MDTKLRSVSVAAAGILAALVAGGCSTTAALPLAGRVQVSLDGRATSAATPVSTPPAPLVSASLPAAAAGDGVAALQSQFIQVVKEVGPSVVQVETAQGLGSGIVFDQRGDIVTNAHVVGSSQSFTVTTAGGAQSTAQLLGVDAGNDLAVIRISPKGLTPAVFADSSTLQVGDLVLALGSPYGLQGSVTQGLVSALNRDIAESRRVTLHGLVQTSAPINPGNSGGALADLAGHVVGIPTLGASGGDGIGFAIPSNTVVSVANRLISTGR